MYPAWLSVVVLVGTISVVSARDDVPGVHEFVDPHPSNHARRGAMSLLRVIERKAEGGSRGQPSESESESESFRVSDGRSGTIVGTRSAECFSKSDCSKNCPPPPPPDGAISVDDRSPDGKLGLAMKKGYDKKGHGNCPFWGDASANSNYKVEEGAVEINGNKIRGYRVNPPRRTVHRGPRFHTELYLKLTNRSDLYSFHHGDFHKLGSFSPGGVGGFVCTDIPVQGLADPVIYVIVPEGTKISSWPEVAKGVQAKLVPNTGMFHMHVARYDISASGGQPFNPETEHVLPISSAGYVYGTSKKFFPVARKPCDEHTGEGVVWQDSKTWKVYVSWLNPKGQNTTEILPGTIKRNFMLVGATSNGLDSIVFLTVHEGSGVAAMAYKVHASSAQLLSSNALPTGPGASGLDMGRYFISGGSMAWDTAGGSVGLILSRKLPNGNEGGIAVSLDDQSLQIKTNFGQTSGHSWASSMAVSRNGGFVGMDLGDNFPRGINIHKIPRCKAGSHKCKMKSKVVYTFKAHHSEDPAGGWPVYPEISNLDHTFYKQSDDNQVYTEIGHQGLIELEDGILVFFASERPPLDNHLALENHNAPRNIGIVKVSNDLKHIVSPGVKIKGGFYDFQGKWVPQIDEGTNWLTSYVNKSRHNAVRLKTSRLGKHQNLVIYELWDENGYVNSQMLAVDDNGKITHKPIVSEYPFRLPPTNDMTVVNGKAVVYSGGPGKLYRYEFGVGIQPGSETEPAQPQMMHTMMHTIERYTLGQILELDIPERSFGDAYMYAFRRAVVEIILDALGSNFKVGESDVVIEQVGKVHVDHIGLVKPEYDQDVVVHEHDSLVQEWPAPEAVTLLKYKVKMPASTTRDDYVKAAHALDIASPKFDKEVAPFGRRPVDPSSTTNLCGHMSRFCQGTNNCAGCTISTEKLPTYYKTPNDNSSDSGLSDADIAAIVTGVLVAVLLIAVAVAYHLTKEEEEDATNAPMIQGEAPAPSSGPAPARGWFQGEAPAS